MKISKVEVFQVDAGWRPWTFVKIKTNNGLHGWSECSDSFGSHIGVKAVVEDLSKLIIGEDPRNIEYVFWKLYSSTRQSTGGIIQKAIAGIENALLDIKAKFLEVPVYELLGGKVRDKLQVYWSHFITTRARSAEFLNVNPIRTIEDLKPLADEVKEKGFTVVKTNILIFEDSGAKIYMPGFWKSEGGPELNIDSALLRKIEFYITNLKQTLGEKVEIILDTNFNFKTEGYVQIAKTLEKFNLKWLEMDSYDPKSLAHIRSRTKTPICSGETLYGARGFKPYFENYSMDIASVDLLWNGLWQSKKISDMAEVYEMNIAPHNHYSHLGGIMSAHFAASIPNFKILEVDIDDVSWKDKLVTKKPKIENGYMEIPDGSGWGVEIDESVLESHPWPKTD